VTFEIKPIKEDGVVSVHVTATKYTDLHKQGTVLQGKAKQRGRKIL
jgi:hypothetical protein